jgi:hypothetical protein
MNEPQTTEVLSIRFVGDALKTRGVAIYDLAQSLISLQRIIHKAHLAEEKRLNDTPVAFRKDREILTLRLGERRRNSDEFGLVTYLTDPALVSVMGTVVSSLITGLILYAHQRSVASRDGTTAPPVVFNISIYNQVVDLVNRVNAVGGVEKIEIRGSKDGTPQTVTLDESTQRYVRGLRNSLVAGETRELQGRVKELKTAYSSITITDGMRTIEIRLPETEFHKVRYSPAKHPWVNVRGRPIYRLGVEGDTFERFDADVVISIEETSDADDVDPPQPEESA